jgi:catechol 2,3-dioxygenase-like lactoylglutathione lyase family enzyme
VARPDIAGIHHLKFAVSDMDRSLSFYGRVLGARRLPKLDHVNAGGQLYAIILEVPNLGTPLELRLNADHAATQKGFDPVTLAVEGRADLQRWVEHLDTEQVVHSPILTALVGWLLAFEDPDGRRIRLYTKERHGPELTPSTDARWL